MGKQVIFRFHKMNTALMFFILSTFIEIKAQSICAPLKSFDFNKYAWLDEIYRPAIDINDSANSVFNKNEEAYNTAWKSYFNSLNKFLHENQFEWEDTVRCVVNIYFNETGRVDFFFYQFSGFDREDEFAALVNKFISVSTFDFSVKRKFRQCGSVRFTDNE